MPILRVRRILRFFGLIVLTFGCCGLLSWLHPLRAAQLPMGEPAELVQRGAEAYHGDRYLEAIIQWEQALTHYPKDVASRDRAIILENLARAHQQIGRPAVALSYWQAVTATYTSLQEQAEVGRAMSEQAQTYSLLGQPFQAISLLCTGDINSGSTSPLQPLLTLDLDDSQIASSSAAAAYHCQPESAIDILYNFGRPEIQVAALGSLGEAYRSVQDYDAALGSLEQGLELAEALGSVRYTALLHNSLGYTHQERAELNYQQAAASLRSASGDEDVFHEQAQTARAHALAEFAQSQVLARRLQDPVIAIKALLGLIAVHAQIGDRSQAALLRDQAMPLLAQLPPNQETAYLALQLTKQNRVLANSMGRALTDATYQASRSQCQDIIRDNQTWTLLQRADAIVEGLDNNRLKAFTQGEIGHFYECAGEYVTARDWTQKAQLAASGDRVLALDTLYIWQWQMGRIYNALGEVDLAVEFYGRATNNLNRVRDEILASNQTLQFDFRDAVAPVYRELAEIQLAQVPASGSETVAGVSDESLQSAGNSLLSKLKSRVSIIAASPSSEVNIRGALGNIDNLQLAELQNYFGSDCLVPVSERRLDETFARQ